MNVQIAQVLGEFDFQKVRRVMELLDWRWADAENGIPEIHEMVAVATRLLVDLKDFETHENSTGGFTAFWFNDGDAEKVPALRFVVETTS